VVVAAFICVILSLGCAHAEREQKLDEKIRTESSLENPQKIREMSKQLIQNNPHLTDQQKQGLLELQATTRKKLDEYLSQSLALRSLLITDVLAENYNADEVALIRDRLKKTEMSRINTILLAADQANRLLGRMMPQQAEVMSSLFDLHSFGR
jgi:formate dehydrogenase maturation protein FdhE